MAEERKEYERSKLREINRKGDKKIITDYWFKT